MKPKKKNLNEQYKNWFSREAPLRIDSAKDDSMIVEGVLATEQPVIVFDWSSWDPVREILIMKGANIPTNGQVPLLDSHSRYSTSQIKGSTRNIKEDVDANNEPILIAEYHFEREAKRDYHLVKDKHLTDTSIGYRTYDEYTIKVGAKESVEIDGKTYRNDYGDGLALLIRTKWDLKENSLVAIGADDRAKFRSQFVEHEETEDENNIPINAKEFEGLKETVKELNNNVIKIISIKGDTPMTDEEKRKIAEDAIKSNREREAKIREFADKFKGQFKNEKELTEKAINENWDVNKFRDQVLDNLDGSSAVETPVTTIGMTKKEAQLFSISRAFDAVLSGNWSKAGREKEAIDAVHAVVQPRKQNSFILPREVQLVGAHVANDLSANFRLAQALNNPDMMRTVLETASNAYGGYLVGTELKGDAFIEMFRNKAVLGQAGITILGGQKQNLDIPKQVGQATFAMVGEGSAAAQSFLTLGHVTSSPKTGSVTTEYTRRLLMQSNPSIDGLILADILALNRNGLDSKGLHGSGTGNDPEGVANASGVLDVDLSTVNWGGIVEHETNIADANAEVGMMKWITNPAVKGKLKTTLKAAGVAGYLMNEDGSMNGYQSLITKNALSQFLFFGVWNQLLLIEYGILELQVNPYGTNARAGNVEVTSFIDFDYIVRHSDAFSVSDNVALV